MGAQAAAGAATEGERDRRRLGVEAVGIFLATRVATLVAVVIAAADDERTVLDLLTKADGIEYLSIVTGGYEPVPDPEPDGSYSATTNLVFFPLYPALVRSLAWALDPRVAALVVTLVAGCFAAWFIAQWAREGAGRVGALVVVALWSLWPASVVLSMAYSEALFTACVAASLWAMQRGSWWWAAVACALAGLTRPTGAALLAALVVGLLIARPGWRRGLGAAVLGSLGLAFSLGHVALATGRVDGWLWLQSTVWRSGFDAGSSLRDVMADVLGGGRLAASPVYVVATATALVAVGLVVVMVIGRVPAREATYAVLAVVMGLGATSYAHSKGRFLLVALPLFVVPARWAARLPRWVLVTAAALVLVVSARWGAYLVVTWPYSV